MTSSLAQTLNAALQTQGPGELTALTRCDRCGGRAQSVFTYPVGFLRLCGRDTRIHLEALLASDHTGFWINPAELWNVTGVDVPAQDHRASGDGLTDG